MWAILMIVTNNNDVSTRVRSVKSICELVSHFNITSYRNDYSSKISN